MTGDVPGQSRLESGHGRREVAGQTAARRAAGKGFARGVAEKTISAPAANRVARVLLKPETELISVGFAGANPRGELLPGNNFGTE